MTLKVCLTFDTNLKDHSLKREAILYLWVLHISASLWQTFIQRHKYSVDIVGDIGYVNALTIKDWIMPKSEIGVIGDAFINNELSEMIYDDNYNDMILKELTSHSDIEPEIHTARKRRRKIWRMEVYR